eukprot:TRINITY_DN9548_c0_g1_i1.p2 TRINITY_DN9548_c0_g1~~TRINITY_DN9548_c0_g1_i1.p2  ORF type:complete len:381 (-),score=61.22 TRINITY_DN9548_c0_g1_i1:11-1153(-)
MIVHPGDPSIIKKSKNNQKMIATKSDQNCVYVWDLDKHKYLPQLKENGSKADIPDLTLVGHEQSSVFALDWSQVGYRIISGGKDNKVLMWDIEDYQAKLAFSSFQTGKRELNSITSMDQNVQLYPIYSLEGHTQSIEDVCFHPSDKNMLVSASDDQTVIGWDVRAANNKAFIIDNIHANDINCIDWCSCNPNYLATGSQDKSACIMDLRTQKELYRIKSNNSNNSSSQLGAVECIKFSNFSQDIIAIGSDNLRFYNLTKISSNENELLKPIFTQLSPKGNVADFDWNLESDWNILSTYQDGENEYDSGGGYLHVFRPLQMVRDGRDEDRTKLNSFVAAKNENQSADTVSYTHLRAHETGRNLVCRLLLEKKKKNRQPPQS